MGEKTGISWTQGEDGSPGSTWNPIRSATGKGWHCVKCSAGCDNCYAETLNMFRGSQLPYVKGADTLMLDMEMMLKPLQWQRPRKIFPCSMTDWMLAEVPVTWIRAMLAVTMLAERHTFQFLTKRADRQERFFNHLKAATCEDVVKVCMEDLYRLVPAAARYAKGRLPSSEAAFLRNVWIGVSVENEAVLWRAEKLAATPAAVRWLSIEPMLGGYVDYRKLLYFPRHVGPGLVRSDVFRWTVFGGESGKTARPFDVDAALRMISDFQLAGVAVWLKQLGSCPVSRELELNVTGKADDPSEWPEALQALQEFPEDVHV